MTAEAGSPSPAFEQGLFAARFIPQYSPFASLLIESTLPSSTLRLICGKFKSSLILKISQSLTYRDGCSKYIWFSMVRGIGNKSDWEPACATFANIGNILPSSLGKSKSLLMFSRGTISADGSGVESTSETTKIRQATWAPPHAIANGGELSELYSG